MEGRTMVRISAGGSGVSVRTVSRCYRSPGSLLIGGRESLQELQRNGNCVIRKGLSVADMSRYTLPSGGECVKFVFLWLEGADDGSITGFKEEVILPYEKFCGCVTACLQDGKERRLLSAKACRRPKIEFRSRCNLKEAAENRTVRKKLGRFLDRKLNWPRYGKIILSDDYEPYSFGFAAYTADGLGMCGGIILHGRDNLKKSYYGIHT